MKRLLVILVSTLVASLSGAREIATASLELIPVSIHPETTVHIMGDEVSAVDFLRLMPEHRQKANFTAVYSVTRAEAVEYARRLTELNRKLGILRKDESLRLPTLSEWRSVATAPSTVREGVRNLDSGVRELCSDTKTERFPSRENPETFEDLVFVAVIGAHDQIDDEARNDLQSRPAWIRLETRSEVIGFRLVLETD